MNMRPNIRRWPIEFYVLCFSVAIFLFTFIYFIASKRPTDPVLLLKFLDPSTLVSDFLGGAYFRLPFLIVFMYMFVKFQLKLLVQIFPNKSTNPAKNVTSVPEYYKKNFP